MPVISCLKRDHIPLAIHQVLAQHQARLGKTYQHKLKPANRVHSKSPDCKEAGIPHGDTEYKKAPLKKLVLNDG